MHKDKCFKYMEKVHNSLTRLYASKACKGNYFKLFKLSPKCKKRIQHRCWRLNKFLRKNFKSCPKTKHMESEDKYLQSNHWFLVHPYCKGVGLEKSKRSETKKANAVSGYAGKKDRVFKKMVCKTESAGRARGCSPLSSPAPSPTRPKNGV